MTFSLSSNYGYAIKSNSGDVDAMKKSVMAALYHSVEAFDKNKKVSDNTLNSDKNIFICR